MASTNFLRRFPHAGHINWFPGHMATAKRAMQEHMSNVDVVIEVRDARIPFTSANPILDDICKHKERLIVCNKGDLANSNMQARVIQTMEYKYNLPCIFSSADKGKHLSSINQWCIDNAKSKFKISGGTIIMIMGIPNVGKSSIINGLRKISSSKELSKGKRMAAVGDTPGLTRRTDLIKISDRPASYIIDTPGVLMPKIKNPEVGLRLALTGAIKDSVVGHELLVNYMLHLLNETNPTRYLKHLNLVEPVSTLDDIVDVVAGISGASGKVEEERLRIVSEYLLREFRRGTFGHFTLDPLP